MPSLSSSISSAGGDINTTNSNKSTSTNGSQPNTPRTSSCSLYQPNNLLYQSSLYTPTVIRSNTFTIKSSSNNIIDYSNYSNNKRYSEPPLGGSSSLQLLQQQPQQQPQQYTKRWDDSQLEMELAEDDLISDNKKVRRNSSLRFKKQQLLSSAESFIIDKFRHPRQSQEVDTMEALEATKTHKKKTKFSFKKVVDWLF